MTDSRRFIWPIVVVLITTWLIVVALPNSAKQWLPAWFSAPELHFGLDLAGGTQLDFRISERELNDQITSLETEMATASGEKRISLQAQLTALEAQKSNLVEAIRAVLERRINALGVSEARITPSEFGGEKHLLVECPGVVDVQECIDTVGKTIQLEFKSENTEQTDEYANQITTMANEAYAKITSGTNLSVVAQDLTNEIAVVFIDSTPTFKDQLPPELEGLWNAEVSSPIKVEGSVTQPRQTADGKFDIQEIPGIYIAEVVSPKTSTGRTITDPIRAMEIVASSGSGLTFMPLTTAPVSEIDPAIAAVLTSDTEGKYVEIVLSDSRPALVYNQSFTLGEESMSARQILLSYSGAFRTASDVTRTKEEAIALAANLQERLANGEDFIALAKEFSDGPAASTGELQENFTREQKDPAYSAAAFALQANEVSSTIETSLGYYIIKAETTPSRTPDIGTFAEIVATTTDQQTIVSTIKATLEENKVTIPEEQISIRYLFFSQMPTGWKDTELDGKHFRSAAVALDEYSRPVVQINFDDKGAQLFAELTKNNIGKRIAIFVGGQLVSAPTVNAEITGGTAIITGSSNLIEAQRLAQDLNTGAIPAPIYLSGQRTIEATLGATALEASIKAALFGVLVLMIYMAFVYRILGLIANIALVGYALIFFALLKLPLALVSNQYIVLTLAGMAGIILSLGMAVDANVLIFERMKEELRKGKLLKTATETGFERAWPSIRDGNFSTFITCGVLFIIGTSIIRGFAITLGLGVAISMFSAIIVTRFLINQIARTSLASKPALFGVKVK